jgi:predicted transcriptional regulator
MRLRTILIA